MCKCINISLMCMCLTTQTERGKWTRDLVVTSRTAAPSCRLLHHSLGANKCTEGEAECKKSLHFSPTKSFTDKRQRVHYTRWLFFFCSFCWWQHLPPSSIGGSSQSYLISGWGGAVAEQKLYTYTMTSRVCIPGWLGSCFCSEWREGEKIASCSTNSITLESPHHLFGGEQKAP